MTIKDKKTNKLYRVIGTGTHDRKKIYLVNTDRGWPWNSHSEEDHLNNYNGIFYDRVPAMYEKCHYFSDNDIEIVDFEFTKFERRKLKL